MLEASAEFVEVGARKGPPLLPLVAEATDINDMKHICYIYVYKFRCLQDVGVSFDHRYNYSFSREQMTLTITQSSSKLPVNFWGEKIWSLTCNVGNNGAGKTTVNRFLLNAVVEGLATKDFEGIVIYENNGELSVYHKEPEELNRKDFKVCKDDFSKCKINDAFTLPSIRTFYYQGHFSVEFSTEDLCTTELTGLYNASEGFLLRDDLEKFANATDLSFNSPFASYFVSHIAQKHQRICRLLTNEELRNIIKKFRFPRYITISPNRGGQDHIKLHPIVPKELKEEFGEMINPLPIGGLVPTKEEYVGMFIYFNILNAIAEDKIDSKEGPSILKRWRETVDNTRDVLFQFKEFGNQYEGDVKTSLDIIFYVLSSMVSLANYDELGGFYIDLFKEKEVLDKLLGIPLLNNYYLTSRFFDLNYSHNIGYSNATLSSGEEAMLNLFSLLYEAVEFQPSKFGSKYAPSLILLDEAEIGFHPEWQRMYISMIVDFLHSLKVRPGHDFQVVITTHSPILLSDVPSCCCNFLQLNDDDMTYCLNSGINETFATNIFEQYRNSFFLKEGLVGCYAEEKLKQLEEKILDGKADVEQEIALIGDSRLQQYFVSLLAKNNKAAAIRYHQEEIRRLEEEVK